MEWKQVGGNWSKYANRVRQHWDALSLDEVQAMSGRRKQLVGALKQHYGITEDHAERQIDEFCAAMEMMNPKDREARKVA